MRKPRVTELLVCPCGSEDTVGLILDVPSPWKDEDRDYVCWCACGSLTIRRGKKIREVFDFKKEDKEVI